MIDWPDDDIALALTRSFANIAASIMASSSGMRFEARDTADGGCEIVTDDKNAVTREYGHADKMAESWSIQGLIEAKRRFDGDSR